MPLLIPCFGSAKQVLHLTNISEVRSLTLTCKNLNGHLLGGVGSCTVLCRQLPVESLQELRVRVIVEVESIFDGESPREPRVDVLDKVSVQGCEMKISLTWNISSI